MSEGWTWEGSGNSNERSDGGRRREESSAQRRLAARLAQLENEQSEEDADMPVGDEELSEYLNDEAALMDFLGAAGFDMSEVGNNLDFAMDFEGDDEDEFEDEGSAIDLTLQDYVSIARVKAGFEGTTIQDRREIIAEFVESKTTGQCEIVEWCEALFEAADSEQLAEMEKITAMLEKMDEQSMNEMMDDGMMNLDELTLGSEPLSESNPPGIQLRLSEVAQDLALIEYEMDPRSEEYFSGVSGEYWWNVRYKLITGLSAEDMERMQKNGDVFELICESLFKEHYESCRVEGSVIDDALFGVRLTVSTQPYIFMIRIQMEHDNGLKSDWSDSELVLEDQKWYEEKDNRYSFGDKVGFLRGESDVLWTTGFVVECYNGDKVKERALKKSAQKQDSIAERKIKVIRSENDQGYQWSFDEVALLFPKACIAYLKSTIQNIPDRETRELEWENMAKPMPDDIAEHRRYLMAEGIAPPIIYEVHPTEVMHWHIPADRVIDLSDPLPAETTALLCGLASESSECKESLTDVYTALVNTLNDQFGVQSRFIAKETVEYLFDREFSVGFECFECSRLKLPSRRLNLAVSWSDILDTFVQVSKQGDSDDLNELDAYTKECDSCFSGIRCHEYSYFCRDKDDPRSHDFCVNCISRLLLKKQCVERAVHDTLCDTLNPDCIQSISHFTFGVIRSSEKCH